VTESAGEFDPVRVIKPWGEELLFAAVEGGYAGKLITIHAGRSASLHRHQRKTETIMVLTGTGDIRLGSSPDSLALLELRPGSCVHIPTSALHQVSARSELQFVEVSTAREGWRSDVERLEDGPSGTSTP
jgi:oxalate decarboxylase/phosphoglucose isomerase-like protein (cupin superfamily)